MTPLRLRLCLLLSCVPLVILSQGGCRMESPSAADAGAPGPDASATECSLDINQYQTCYTGPADTESVGACRAGGRLCQSGQWTECRYQTLPTAERCNQIDDDCNGTIDDDLQDECGRCEPVPGPAALCLGSTCLRSLPSPVGLRCADACCDCITLAEATTSASFHEIFFLCDHPGLCAEAGESDRAWDQFIIDATIPGASSISMRFRAAVTKEALATATWHDASVDAEDASIYRFAHSDAFQEYVEVEVTLSEAGESGLELCRLRAIPVQYI